MAGRLKPGLREVCEGPLRALGEALRGSSPELEQRVQSEVGDYLDSISLYGAKPPKDSAEAAEQIGGNVQRAITEHGIEGMMKNVPGLDDLSADQVAKLKKSLVDDALKGATPDQLT